MVKDEQPGEETDIQVTSHGANRDEGADPRAGGAKGVAKMAIDRPKDVMLRIKVRYKHLNNRDKMAVLIGVLAVILTIVLMSIWTTGGGIGGISPGPEILPSSRWNMDPLSEVLVTGNEENTNLEGQETPYLVPLTPMPGEIYFLTHLSCQVTWADESTPPTQAPAVGYSNEPDGFQLFITIHDGVGTWESPIEFNSMGSSETIELEVAETDLGIPIAVANPEGASYLPQGYVENLRVDFIVRTDDCGEWTSSDPFRPSIGDGGNHFTFDWSVVYRQADSTKSP
jgi:hypothetical protein